MIDLSKLSPAEKVTLKLFMETNGGTVDEIARLWGSRRVSKYTVQQHIRCIRRKLVPGGWRFHYWVGMHEERLMYSLDCEEEPNDNQP